VGAPAREPAGHDPGPGYGQLLRRRALWGVSLGQFCYAWQFYLLLTWMPLYLVRSQHLSLTAMAGVGAAVYALQALAALAGGWASDTLIRSGASPTVVRKGVILTGVAGAGAAILLLSLGLPQLTIPCLAASGLFTGLGNPMQFSIGQTLSGPTAGGRWMGVQNMFGNFAGILAPAATGWIVQTTGTFAAAFQLAAALSVAGLVCWGLVLVRVEPLDWRSRSPAAPVPEPG
jgi:fucose permease